MRHVFRRVLVAALTLLVAPAALPAAARAQHVRESLVDVAAAAPSDRTGTRVAEAIAARLLEVHGVAAQDLRIPPLLDLEALAADPATRIAVDLSPRAGTGASLPVSVSILRHGMVLQRAAVTARVVIERPVLVAARTLTRGARLRADDVREELRADAPTDALGASIDAIGQRLVRGIPAGAPLREAFLEATPLVTRGQSVMLRASRGSLAIEAAGRALEDGRTGDTIRVMNLASRRVLAGQVAADGAIEMGF